jgi:murein DD-endopeptidase MepM/ murein hydrolase activator NlpD
VELLEEGKIKYAKRRRSHRWILVMAFLLLMILASVLLASHPEVRAGKDASSPRPDQFIEVTPEPTSVPTPTPAPTAEPTEEPATPEPTVSYSITAIVINGETYAYMASYEAAEALLASVEEYFVSLADIPADAITELRTDVELVELHNDLKTTSYDEAFKKLTGSNTPLEFVTTATYFEDIALSHTDKVIKDRWLPAGIRVMRVYGRDGLERRTYAVTYVNGRKQKLEVKEDVIVLEPIDGDIRIGEREFPEDYVTRRTYGSFPNEAARLGMKVPVHGEVVKLYGPFTGGFHHGIDIMTEEGTEVLAAADGTVVSVMERGAYGLMIEIEHQLGVTTRYARLGTAAVSVGDTVQKGDVIGTVGHSEEYPHLHFELRIRGTAYNPLKILSVYDIKG